MFLRCCAVIFVVSFPNNSKGPKSFQVLSSSPATALYHVYWPIKGINICIYILHMFVVWLSCSPICTRGYFLGFFRRRFNRFLCWQCPLFLGAIFLRSEFWKFFWKFKNYIFKKYMLGKQSVWAIYAAQTGANDILNSFGNKHSIAATGIVKNIRKE